MKLNFYFPLVVIMLLICFNVQPGYAQNCPNFESVTFRESENDYILRSKLFQFDVKLNDEDARTYFDIIVTSSDGSVSQIPNSGTYISIFAAPNPVLGCDPIDKSFEATIKCQATGDIVAEFDLGTYKHYPVLDVNVVQPGCHESQPGSATLLSVSGDICAEPVEGRAGISGNCDLQRNGRLVYDFRPFPEIFNQTFYQFYYNDVVESLCAGYASGCTDADACNYDASAVCDDGSCVNEDACCPLPVAETFPEVLSSGIYNPEVCITFDGDISLVDLTGFHIRSIPNSLIAYPNSRNTFTNQICFNIGGNTVGNYCGVSEVDFVFEYTCFNGKENESFNVNDVLVFPPPESFKIYTDPATECGGIPQPAHLGIPFSCGNFVIEETQESISDCNNLTPGFINYYFDTGLDLSRAPSHLMEVLSGKIVIPPCEQDCPCNGTLCYDKCSDSNLSLNITSGTLPQVACYDGTELSFEITGLGASYLSYLVKFIYQGQPIGSYTHNLDNNSTTFDYNFQLTSFFNCEPITGLLEWEIICWKDSIFQDPDADEIVLGAGTIGNITVYPNYRNFVPRSSEGQFCESGILLRAPSCGTLVYDLEENPNALCGIGSEHKVLSWSVEPGFDTTDAPDCFIQPYLSGELTCLGEAVKCPCNCTTTNEPVCGLDGNTYLNECEATCETEVEVAYTGSCNTSNRFNFDNHTWLNSYNTDDLCEHGMTIREYEYSGSYSFIHVQSPDGKGDLFLSNGTHYCTDSPGHSCLDTYNLSKIMNAWTCDINAVELVDNEADESGNEEETTNENEIIEETESETPVVSETENESQAENEVFSKYSWLKNYINSNDCLNGNKVTEFDFSSYSFVFVENSEGGKLYYQDGTLYCTTKPSYDCLTLYGFNNPSKSWACEDGNGNEEENVIEEEEENENENENTQDIIFSTYPWLDTLIDANDCSNASLAVYAYGNYEFISIENREGTSLYFQDGTFYCSDEPNYSCTSLYELSIPKNEWQCKGGVANQKQALPFSQLKIDFDSDFKVYPNPSNGKFMIEMDKSQSIAVLNIISTDGKLIQSIKVTLNQQFLDVSIDGAPKGIYLLQLIDLNKTIQQSKRIIIH